MGIGLPDEALRAMDEAENPCVGICVIGEDGRCEGCGRTEAEIYGEPAEAPEPGA